MIHIIMNPTSRTGHTREIWAEIERYLEKEEISYELHETKYAGHAAEIAKEISEAAKHAAGADAKKDVLSKAGAGSVSNSHVADDYETIYLVGGDGTANEVVNGITDFSHIRFGYVPTGSGNDLGRGLGIKREPVEQMKHVLTSKDYIDMDLGEVRLPDGTARKFTISAGIGLDADVCKQALTSKLKVFLNKIHLGSLTYGILTVLSLFSMPVSDAVLTAKNGKGEVKELKEHNMIFTAAMNHPWEGGGVPMAPDADPCDGRLSMISVSDVSRLRCLLMFPTLLAGKHAKLKPFRLFRCHEITIRLKKPMVVHADGEYCGTVPEVSFACLPGKLRVIV